MIEYRDIENLDIDFIVNDIMHKFEGFKPCKEKDSLRKTVTKIVKFILNPKRKSIYRRISIYPYKYPDDLDEYILNIGKIDNILFYEIYYSKRSLVIPRYLYLVENEIRRYEEVLKYSPFSYWMKKQCEKGYKIAISTVKGFKLPEFAGNEQYFYRVDKYKIKKRKSYAIIQTLYEYSFIVCTKDDFVIVQKDLFNAVKNRFTRIVNGETLLEEIRKEILLNSL